MTSQVVMTTTEVFSKSWFEC